MAGRMYVRSTRSLEKQHAIDAAKRFYDELLLRYRQRDSNDADISADTTRHIRPISTRNDRPKTTILFGAVAERAIDTERGRMMRGELATQSFRALSNRLRKQICPILGGLSIRAVSPADIQQLIDRLVQRKASSVTIAQYLQAVRLV